VITDDDVEAARKATIDVLETHGVRVLDAREARFSLEDVFISVVERARTRHRAASAV
jgi:hypothetical protein